jgi:hypothetical protein
VVEQKGEGLVNRRGINQVVVVQDEDKAAGMAAISLSRVVSSASVGGGCGDCSAASTPAPSVAALPAALPRASVCNAATR